MTLHELPFDRTTAIVAIDWDALSARDARRLRELGFDEGVSVTSVYGGGFVARDPLAVRVGRMTVAIRAAHARAIRVEQPA